MHRPAAPADTEHRTNSCIETNVLSHTTLHFRYNTYSTTWYEAVAAALALPFPSQIYPTNNMYHHMTTLLSSFFSPRGNNGRTDSAESEIVEPTEMSKLNAASQQRQHSSKPCSRVTTLTNYGATPKQHLPEDDALRSNSPLNYH